MAKKKTAITMPKKTRKPKTKKSSEQENHDPHGEADESINDDFKSESNLSVQSDLVSKAKKLKTNHNSNKGMPIQSDPAELSRLAGPSNHQNKTQHSKKSSKETNPLNLNSSLLIQNPSRIELSSQLSNLLSRDPSSSSLPPQFRHAIPSSPENNNLSHRNFNFNDWSSNLISSLNNNLNQVIEGNHQDDDGYGEKDRRIALLEEKLKLYEKQNFELQSVSREKDQLFKELSEQRETEQEKELIKFREAAETQFTDKNRLIKSQIEEINESRQIIKELGLKLNKIYSGEEEKERQRLEEEKQELLEANEQLKVGFESQRQRRKEAERELKRARIAAEEEVKDHIRELEIEQETLKKMLEVETSNSKALIAQLNQVRSTNNSLNPSNLSGKSISTATSTSTTVSNEVIEELKTKIEIIGDFTGFEILRITKDIKGPIYDCVLTDVSNHGFALSFKLQKHRDGTFSYDPSLDPSRDFETIKVIPEFFRQFLRFDIKNASGPFFVKLFKSFNFDDSVEAS